jgi:hypothetical protein
MFGVFPEVYKFTLVSKFNKDFRENIPSNNIVGTEKSGSEFFSSKLKVQKI